MEPPSSCVGDADTPAPALTLRYANGETELDLRRIYNDITSLLEHPGRARLDQEYDFVSCSDEFLDRFWSAAASLLDYFADFYTTDTALMQSVWLHLLDVWQQARPTQVFSGHVLEDPDFLTIHELKKDYQDTIALVQRLISSNPATQPKMPHDAIIHDPSGETEGPGGWYEQGPVLSGLKPWQQFLYAGSPGFQPPCPSPSPNDPPPAAAPPSRRYLPQPAIALLQTHTARARTLTTTLAPTLSWDLVSTLSAFDAHALPFPTSPRRSHSRPSLTHPHRIRTYQLAQGAPRVRRHEGLTDPSMLVEEPGFVLLDEALGVCRGVEVYVPMTGPVGRAGVGFDVWGVWEGEGEGLGTGRGSVLGRGFGKEGDMFDEWEVRGEEEGD